jgi:hypothetical protein
MRGIGAAFDESQSMSMERHVMSREGRLVPKNITQVSVFGQSGTQSDGFWAPERLIGTEPEHFSAPEETDWY